MNVAVRDRAGNGSDVVPGGSLGVVYEHSCGGSYEPAGRNQRRVPGGESGHGYVQWA